MEFSDPFLKKGIMLVVDGSDQELMRSILETEISVTKARHADNRAVLDAAAAYSPAFGMIGTLIGLINMLKNLDDMSTLAQVCLSRSSRHSTAPCWPMRFSVRCQNV
jgi:chemotaxis protein MotA